MNPTEPLRPGTPEIPPEQPEKETSEDLKATEKEATPVIETELPESESENKEGMIIEEPAEDRIKPQKKPESSDLQSDGLEESDVRDDPLNTAAQAAALQGRDFGSRERLI